MLCEETQQALSLYIDDKLTQGLRVLCDEHLEHCPVCREELAQLRALSRSLSGLGRPALPSSLIPAITDALAIEAAARARQPHLPLNVRITRWLEPRLMPYTVGTIGSILLFITLFGALRPHLIALRDAAIARQEADDATIKVVYERDIQGGFEITKPVTPAIFADGRAPFAVESPSLNPHGALAELTNSITHGHDADDDMIVVTDVFSNGRAALADVVQAPRDKRMLVDFQDALRKNPAFVPASFDRRPETMRVVFAIQKVSVQERKF